MNTAVRSPRRTLEMLAGRTIEQMVAHQIQERYAVILTANIETDGKRGPRMEGDNGTVVLADMQIYGDRYGWLDVKAKTTSNLFRNLNRIEHGIDKSAFTQYCQLQLKTHMPVYILICELDTAEILIADIDTLRSNKPRVGRWPDGKESVNWDRRVFQHVGVFDIPNDDLTRIKIGWDWKKLGSFLVQLSIPFMKAA